MSNGTCIKGHKQKNKQDYLVLKKGEKTSKYLEKFFFVHQTILLIIILASSHITQNNVYNGEKPAKSYLRINCKSRVIKSVIDFPIIHLISFASLPLHARNKINSFLLKCLFI